MDSLLTHLKNWDPNGNGEITQEQLVIVLKELDPKYWHDEKIAALFEVLPDPISIEKFAKWLYAPEGTDDAPESSMSNEAVVKLAESRGMKVLQDRASIDVALCKKIKPEEREVLREVFNKYDKDCSGSMDLAELTKMCTELGGKLTESEATMAMKQLDKDGSGRCDFDEFLLYWTSKPTLGGYDEVTLQLMKSALATKAAAAKVKSKAAELIGVTLPDGKAPIKTSIVVSPNMGPFEAKSTAKLSMSKAADPDKRSPRTTVQIVAADAKAASLIKEAFAVLFGWMNEDEDMDAPFTLEASQAGNIVNLVGVIKEEVAREMFDDPEFQMMIGMFAQFYDSVDATLDWSNDVSDLVLEPDKHLFEHVGGVRLSFDAMINYGYLNMMMSPGVDAGEMAMAAAQAWAGSGTEIKLGYFQQHLKAVGTELASMGVQIWSLQKMQKWVREDREARGPPPADPIKRMTQLARILKELAAATNLESIAVDGVGPIQGRVTFEKFQPWLLVQYLLQPRIDADVESKEDLPAPLGEMSAVRDVGDRERNRIKGIFTKYDKDGSGAIDLKELEAMIKELGGSITTEEVQQAINELDKDGSFTVNFDEFMLWWCSKPGLGGYSSVALGFLRMKMLGWNALMKSKKFLVNNTLGVTEDDETVVSAAANIAPNLSPIEEKMFATASFAQEVSASSSDDASMTIRLIANSADDATNCVALLKEEYEKYSEMLPFPLEASFEAEDAELVMRIAAPADVVEALTANAPPDMLVTLLTMVQSLLDSSATISFGSTCEEWLEKDTDPLPELLAGARLHLKSGVGAAGRSLLSGISMKGFKNVFRPLIRSFAGLSLDYMVGYKPKEAGKLLTKFIETTGCPSFASLSDIRTFFHGMCASLPEELFMFLPSVISICKSLKGVKTIKINGFLPKPGADGSKLYQEISFESFSIFPLVLYFIENMPNPAEED